MPAPSGGRLSAGKVSTYGRSPTVKARSPAPTSVITARTSSATISNCSPVSGMLTRAAYSWCCRSPQARSGRPRSPTVEVVASSRRLRALITNDDGIDSPGLWTLARGAQNAGFEVIVAAPHIDSSGVGASVLSVRDGDGDALHTRELDALPGVPAYAVEGHPAFIVHAAGRGWLDPEPDVVLSGINLGSNVGHAVLHSGTVGAALTASLHGWRGLAVSLDSGWQPPERPHWESVLHVLPEVLDILLAGPEGKHAGPPHRDVLGAGALLAGGAAGSTVTRSCVGAGAGAYEVARTRYRRGTADRSATRTATGCRRWLTSGSWGSGGRCSPPRRGSSPRLRATGLRRRDRGLPCDPERIGALTMFSVVVVFGFHSLARLDVVRARHGRGRAVVRGLGRRPRAAACAAGGARCAGAAAPARRRWRPEPGSAIAALAVLGLALTICWTALQPVRAANAEERSADLVAEGKFPQALAAAQDAEQRNPLSVDPLFQLAFIQDERGDRKAALATLESAVHLQPDDSETWRRLGRYRLSVLDDPEGAMRAFRVAYFLDPQSARGPSDYLEAARAAEAKQP